MLQEPLPLTAHRSPLRLRFRAKNAKFTFNGTAGQVIAVLLDNNAFVPAGVSMTILAPDGSTFKGTGNASVPEFIDDTHYCSNGFVGYVCGNFPLPTSGIYTLLLSAGNGGAGSARVRIFTVPIDCSASGSLGGPSIPITIGTAGQNGRVTFTGTQGGESQLDLTTPILAELSRRGLLSKFSSQMAAFLQVRSPEVHSHSPLRPGLSITTTRSLSL